MNLGSWPFTASKRKLADRAREIERDIKVLESQQALIEAATQTADAANFVTTKLKAKLDDSVAQLESTARILNDALIITDLNGRIQAFNPAAETMFGRSVDEVRDTFVGDIIHSDECDLSTPEAIWSYLPMVEAHEGHDLKGRRGAESFPLEVNHTRLDRSDGTSIVLLIMRDSSFDIAGSTIAKGYRSIFENSFDGILVVADHRIVAANTAATELFGYSVEELLAKSLESLFITRVPDGESDTRKAEAAHHDGHRMELQFTINNIWWNAVPASLVTIKEIPFDKHNTHPAGPNMICCFDRDFKITFANKSFAAFHNAKKESLVGVDIRDLLPPEQINAFLINIGSLTPEAPTRRMHLRHNDDKSKVQVWTDSANFEDDDIEYQRIGFAKTITKATI